MKVYEKALEIYHSDKTAAKRFTALDKLFHICLEKSVNLELSRRVFNLCTRAQKEYMMELKKEAAGVL